ncbi:hypothetical protein NMY22_g8733 [Coprinellus aureogranulatus]|nr:hypothetical protein NMY22_g8733 [Coprinellus aureogranulatus]
MHSTIYRPLPSFTLAISQLCEASMDEHLRDLTRSTSPSPPPVDLMMLIFMACPQKTVDYRTDPCYEDDGGDYYRYRTRGSSDYDDDTEYEDDTDTQTLLDDPLPMTYYATKLERQSPHANVNSSKSSSRSRRQSTKSMPVRLYFHSHVI